MAKIVELEYIDQSRVLDEAIAEKKAQVFIPNEWTLMEFNGNADRIPLGHTVALLFHGRIHRLDGSNEPCRLALVIPDESLREITVQLADALNCKGDIAISLLKDIAPSS